MNQFQTSIVDYLASIGGILYLFKGPFPYYHLKAYLKELYFLFIQLIKIKMKNEKFYKNPLEFKLWLSLNNLFGKLTKVTL